MEGFVNNVQASLTAENTFSNYISLKTGGLLTLSGTFSATVSLQRRGSDGNTVDVTNNSGTPITFTGPGTYTVTPGLFMGAYRFGIKTGNYTSGTLVGVLEGK